MRGRLQLVALGPQIALLIPRQRLLEALTKTNFIKDLRIILCQMLVLTKPGLEPAASGDHHIDH